MKLNKLLNTTAFALFALASTSTVSAAIDAEFAAMNNVSVLKMRASHYKNLPHAAAHHAHIGDDIDALYQGIDDGDLAAYGAVILPKMIASANAFIDYLLPADGAFLHNAPAAVANAPANQTKNAFKTSLAAVINGELANVTGVAVPLGGTSKQLNVSIAAADALVGAAVQAWAATLLAGPDAQFLDAAFAARCAGNPIVAQGNLPEPATNFRDAFALALSMAVQNHA